MGRSVCRRLVTLSTRLPLIEEECFSLFKSFPAFYSQGLRLITVTSEDMRPRHKARGLRPGAGILVRQPAPGVGETTPADPALVVSTKKCISCEMLFMKQFAAPGG